MKVVGDDLHAKRVLSLSNATVGVIEAGALAICAIGRALAFAEGLDPKHAVKQVDRLLSNDGVDPWTLFARWVPFVIAERKEIVVALDWTDFEKDDQTTLALHLITSHGRATPLMWLTVRKSELSGQRNSHEDRLLHRFKEVLPQGVLATVLADRGFGDSNLYGLLWELGFNWVIRFRECIKVTDDRGETRTASEWVPTNGRPRLLRDATVTGAKAHVPAVVCVKRKGMAEAWCLAAGSNATPASEIVKLYGKRFTIEENFRDTKNIRFGMGLASVRIASPQRRDRLLLISAIATTLLTLLGAAGEAVGLDRRLKANTVKTRTHSLFFQGCCYYAALPKMKTEQFEALATRFCELVAEQRVFKEIFGVI